MTRTTRSDIVNRTQSLNHRMAERGSRYRYFVQRANGTNYLHRIYPNGTTVATVTAGTAGEISQYLHLMMVALDDADQHAATDDGEES